VGGGCIDRRHFAGLGETLSILLSPRMALELILVVILFASLAYSAAMRSTRLQRSRWDGQGRLSGGQPRFQTAAPKSAPTPVVMAMANAPQNVTRPVLRQTLAPPARAAAAPSTARNNSDEPVSHGIKPPTGGGYDHNRRRKTGR
jgi:hypothetical protein